MTGWDEDEDEDQDGERDGERDGDGDGDGARSPAGSDEGGGGEADGIVLDEAFVRAAPVREGTHLDRQGAAERVRQDVARARRAEARVTAKERLALDRLRRGAPRRPLWWVLPTLLLAGAVAVWLVRAQYP